MSMRALHVCPCINLMRVNLSSARPSRVQASKIFCPHSFVFAKQLHAGLAGLFSHACRYLSAWHQPLVAVARRFASMTSASADQVKRELDKLAAGDEKTRQLLRVCSGLQMPCRQQPRKAWRPIRWVGPEDLPCKDVNKLVKMRVCVLAGQTALPPHGVSSMLRQQHTSGHNRYGPHVRSDGADQPRQHIPGARALQQDRHHQTRAAGHAACAMPECYGCTVTRGCRGDDSGASASDSCAQKGKERHAMCAAHVCLYARASPCACRSLATRTRPHRSMFRMHACLQVVEWAPSKLIWQGLSVHKSPSASFEAVSSDGRLFSLNVLDGTVLVDGLPPGRLPKDITEHRLFR